MDAIQSTTLWVEKIVRAAQTGRAGLATEESNRARFDASCGSPAEFPGTGIEVGGRRYLEMQIERQYVGGIGDQKLGRQAVAVTRTPGSAKVHEPKILLVA